MKKGVILVIFLALLVLLILNYVSAENINSCRALNDLGVYTLTQNVSSSGTCFSITANDVILDCNGYTINFSSSSPGVGVYSNSENTTVKNCIIRQTNGFNECYGIEFNGASNGFIDNNDIRTECNGSFTDSSQPIYFYGADYNSIINTNTTSSGGWENGCADFSFGLWLEESEYNNISNFRESGGYDGLALKGANYNNFVNVTSFAFMDNMQVWGSSSYNNFTNLYVHSAYGDGLLALSSDQNSFFHSNFFWASSGIIHLSGLSGEYNFTNTTINSSAAMSIEDGKMNVFWLVDVYINDSNGNPVNEANVSAYDKNAILINTQLTNSSGYIQRVALRQYMRNVTGVYYDTNYTFNANKIGYSYDAGSGPLNLTTNYIDSNKVWITLTDDNALTALFGTNPADTYNSNSSSMTFDLKCSYNSNVDTIQLWTNSTGVWHANYTNSSYTNGTWLNITINGIPNNPNYKWAVYCNNSSGSIDWTGNRTFNVDATAPIAEQGTNPLDYYNNSGGIITFDVKCSDNVAVDTIQLWTNITGTWRPSYTNPSYQNNTWLNITLMGIHNGNYRWAVYCKDTSGSIVLTTNRTFNVTDGSQISDCTNITFEGVYTLNQSIISNATCIYILADDVTLDCQGNTINFSFYNETYLSAGVGVYSNSSNTTIKNCIITQTMDMDNSYGIEFDGANNGLIDNNSIALYPGNPTWSYGIYLKNADYNRITNTNTTSGGFGTAGITFDGADYNNVTNSRQNATKIGILLGRDYISASYYNNFINVTSISSSDNSLFFGSGTGDNNFTNCYFESANGVALFAGWSDHNSFFNSVMTGATSISTSGSAGELNFTNCTIDSAVTLLGGTLNVFWLADVYVNDSNGVALLGANVTAKNKNNVLKDWGLTNSSGYTKRLILREYQQNTSGKFYDTKYTFNASKNGYSSDSEQVNLTSNVIPGDLGKVILTLESTSAPNISSFNDYTIYLPNQVTLDAFVTSESDFTVEWSKVSGPGPVTFSDSSKTITDVSFSLAGEYVLRLTADDGEFSRYQDVNVEVLSEPTKITVKKSGTGTGNISGLWIDCGSDCSEVIDGEAEITLEATASEGSVFAGWVGAGCLGNESDTCIINVNGTKEVTAFFDLNTTGIHVYYVSNDGDDDDDGSVDTPWQTIQHAADTAIAGDKVVIKAGEYNEFVTLSNSGTEENPIIFEGERDANGDWLTIIDPSTDASSEWVAAPEIGSGVWKKDMGFTTRELTINQKRVGFVYSMEDMVYINSAYGNLSYTTGAELLAVPTDEIVYIGSQIIRFWDGIEAMWGASGNTTYLRLRNGSNPNGMDIGVTPHPNWDSTTFLVAGKSYLDFRNLHVRGSTGAFYLYTNDTHHVTIESNYLIAGSTRVALYGGPYQNLIRNNEMTDNLYGYSDPGAWGGIQGYRTDDYRYRIREYQYRFSKYIMGASGSDDYCITMDNIGDDNVVSGNHLFKSWGMGISISGQDFENPLENTEIYDNVIENNPSIGILVQPGQVGTKIHDNLLRDNNINIRFHKMSDGNEINRTVYIYRNKFWQPEAAGDQIFVHFWGDPSEYHPEFWIYQNSFTGGFYGFGNGGSNPDCCSMPNISLLNNIFSGIEFSLVYGSQFGENATAMGPLDYNFFAPLTLSYFPPIPVWYLENNLNQSNSVWDLSLVPDYSLEEGSIAIDAGIDLSQPFTINGTEYPALPGMEPGYFLGSAPDMGAVEYDNTTMIISRNNPEHNYITDSSSITFDFKCLYNLGVDTIELFTDTTGDWHLNYTNSSYTSNTWLNITRTGITQGVHKWMIYCNGTDGNSSITGNRTFTVDLINPTAEQGTNPTAGYQDSSGSIKFDMKCSDNLGVSSIQLQTDISGTLQTEYTNSSYQNDTWLNITIEGITSGSYIWQVYCEDTAGNSDTTSSRAFSSTYAAEEQQEQKKGGGGGGGGGGDEEKTNQTQNNVNDNNLHNINNTNQSQGQDSGTGEQKVKNKLQKYWWLILVTVVVIAGLIILGSIKKKESF